MYKKENGSLLHLKAAGKVLFFLPPLRYYGISFLCRFVKHLLHGL